jgi:hypothetical protein
MKTDQSLEGIISYLTKKHGGNVHEKGIVTITSKWVRDDPKFALKNVADLTSRSDFISNHEPDQWVCWDFREMGVRPTHYTIFGPNSTSSGASGRFCQGGHVGPSKPEGG